MRPSAAAALPLPADLASIHIALQQGHKMTGADAERLFVHPDLLAVAALADEVAERKCRLVATYSRPLRVSLTRFCSRPCRVCDSSSGEGSSPSLEVVLQTLRSRRPDEVHLLGTGGLSLGDVEGWLHRIREALPGAFLQGFVAGDLAALARRAGVSLDQAASCLQRAGLDALLGTDEELYTRQGRQIWSGELPIRFEEALGVHAAAHRAGLTSIATLLYSCEAEPAAIISRLEAIRAQQRETSGFNVFVPIPRACDDPVRVDGPLSGYEDIRCAAVARVLLGNVPHIRVPWMALGLKMGQVALRFGADDVGWVPLDPHVRAFAPPTAFMGLDEAELRRALVAAGRKPQAVDGSGRSVGMEIEPTRPGQSGQEEAEL